MATHPLVVGLYDVGLRPQDDLHVDVTKIDDQRAAEQEEHLRNAEQHLRNLRQAPNHHTISAILHKETSSHGVDKDDVARPEASIT